jgi:alpha-1,2-mannosyltransferase
MQITPGGGAAGALRARHRTRAASGRITPNKIIVTLAMLAAALRLYYLTRPGFLFGVTEYDDGSYLGSAIRLVAGQLPYRDFVFVQPPGITLLLVPVALLGKVAGTAWAMAAGRILTVAAGTAGVALTGRLVRDRGTLAVLLACGICAVHPDGVAAAHTIMIEPWLVLFCLIGAVTVFDAGRLATGRRLLWAGVALGFAGAVESWAVVPVLVLLGIAVAGRRWRQAGVLLGGAAAGFGLPTLPFAALAPAGFYRSVVTAQVGHRVGAARIYSVFRLRLMAGLSDFPGPGAPLVLAVVAAIAGLVLAGFAVSWHRAGRPPAPLDWFAPLSAGLTGLLFLWPPQFHYHFVAFLVPFLGLSVGLAAQSVAGAAAELAGARPLAARLRPAVCGLGALAIVAAAAAQVAAERPQRTTVSPAAFTAVRRVIPPGACVLADQVSYLVVADRFVSRVPGCPAIDDGTGINFALSGGLSAATGAGRVPAVAAMWRSALRRVQFVWLSQQAALRIPWTPALRTYFRAHFARVPGLGPGLSLYRRRLPARRPAVPHKCRERDSNPHALSDRCF